MFNYGCIILNYGDSNKVPVPDPFPEWNIPPLPQSLDNGQCYSREQGSTVSRLLAYSPGLITLTLRETVLLGKAVALGKPILNSDFIAGPETGICPRADVKTMQSHISIQIQKVNIDCTGDLIQRARIHECASVPKGRYVGQYQDLCHSHNCESCRGFNSFKVTDHTEGEPLRRRVWIA